MGQAEQLDAAVSALRTTSGIYNDTGTELTAITIGLSGVMQNLLVNWQGSSQQAFVQACNRAWGDQQAVSGSLSGAATALNTLAGTLETQAISIRNLERLENSDTIKPPQLQAAQSAADTAWAAIAAAVAQQAGAVNAAATQVGVCSTGEGGPWGDTGLNDTVAASKIKDFIAAYRDMVSSWPRSARFLWMLLWGTAFNSSSAVLNSYFPSSLQGYLPVVITNAIGMAFGGFFASKLASVGLTSATSEAFLPAQAFLGGLLTGGATVAVTHNAFPPNSLPAGEKGEFDVKLPDGTSGKVVVYKDGKVVFTDAQGHQTSMVGTSQGFEITVKTPQGEQKVLVPLSAVTSNPSPQTTPAPAPSTGSPSPSATTGTPSPQASPGPQPTPSHS